MAQPSTMHRISIGLSDVDRGVYETLDFRLARHPSESADGLVMRTLAFALEWSPDLAFGPGLCVADEPSLFVREPTGALHTWIDIGHPAPQRLHKAGKVASRVLVWSHKPLRDWARALGRERVHRAEALEVGALPPAFVTALAADLGRTLAWDVLLNEGTLYVTVGERTLEAPVGRWRGLETMAAAAEGWDHGAPQ